MPEENIIIPQEWENVLQVQGCSSRRVAYSSAPMGHRQAQEAASTRIWNPARVGQPRGRSSASASDVRRSRRCLPGQFLLSSFFLQILSIQVDNIKCGKHSQVKSFESSWLCGVQVVRQARHDEAADVLDMHVGPDVRPIPGVQDPIVLQSQTDEVREGGRDGLERP